NRRDVALKILMVIYGDVLAGFIGRLVADPARTRVIFHDVFMAAFRGIRRFERGKHAHLWGWLCQITYEKIVEDQQVARSGAPAAGNPDNFDVGNAEHAAPSHTMDGDRTRTLEACLTRLPVPLRAQL